MKKVLVLPGDGIGPEIVAQAVRVLDSLIRDRGLALNLVEGHIGGAAYDQSGSPLPEETLEAARQADAALLGAVGGPKWDLLPPESRPESGLLKIRKALDLYANLRPATLYPQLAAASSLRAEIVSGLDLMIVRELTGGIYFGEPRGIRHLKEGQREGFNTLVYRESEIERIVRVACETATKRQGKVCSIDKANVLEVSALWREVADRVARDYPDVTLSHMYVDNAAMQLVRQPKQFDVMVTGNMFGDILSDCAAMLTGSIGMLPSASLNAAGQGLYEPVHGSAPDIADKDIANPLAAILSAAIMLRYSLGENAHAHRIEDAVGRVLDQGLRTADIMSEGMRLVGTREMGNAVVAAL